MTQTQLEVGVAQARKYSLMGRLPHYIPLLAQVDPATFAVQVHSVTGAILAVGAIDQSFALMSVIKPFVLLFLLEQLGEAAVYAQVGLQPSEQPFHSLAQLAADQGFPRNPMINSGAIVLAANLPGEDGTARCEKLRQWLNQQASSNLVLDQAMLESVRSLDNKANQEIAALLLHTGYLKSVELALDTYNQICCLSGTVTDLARLGLLLANRQSRIATQHQQVVNALMLTCGLYEVSGYYAVKIGLPIKSGVSGALLAVVPGEGAIACYSPALDAAGNSIAGLFLLEQLAKALNLSVFS